MSTSKNVGGLYDAISRAGRISTHTQGLITPFLTTHEPPSIRPWDRQQRLAALHPKTSPMGVSGDKVP